jgi:hypothetical protein
MLIPVDVPQSRERMRACERFERLAVLRRCRRLLAIGALAAAFLVFVVAVPRSAQADPLPKKDTVTSPAGSGGAYRSSSGDEKAKRKRAPTVSSRAAGGTLGSTAIDTVAGRPPRTINPSGDPRPLPRCPDCAPKPGAKPTGAAAGGPTGGTNASNNNSPSIPASGGTKGGTVPSGGHGGISLVQPGGVSVPQPLTPPAPAPTISSGGASPPGAPK